jgi:hypothetical protein
VKSGNARNGHIWKGMVTKNEYAGQACPLCARQKN